MLKLFVDNCYSKNKNRNLFAYLDNPIEFVVRHDTATACLHYDVITTPALVTAGLEEDSVDWFTWKLCKKEDKKNKKKMSEVVKYCAEQVLNKLSSWCGVLYLYKRAAIRLPNHSQKRSGKNNKPQTAVPPKGLLGDNGSREILQDLRWQILGQTTTTSGTIGGKFEQAGRERLETEERCRGRLFICCVTKYEAHPESKFPDFFHVSRLVPVAWQQWSEMEALIPSPAACEVRSEIKFFNAQSIAPIEIHRQLCQVYGPNIRKRSGRPSLINDDRVELVRQCIMENRRFTITELSSHFPQILRSLLHEIVTKHLLFKNVCARWVTKNLTPEHKTKRLGAALTFLQRYHDDGDEFLDRIVTGDEIWISHFTPETKQQSKHWRHSGSPVRTKFKQTLSVRKVMCTVFWNRKGILLIDFLPRGVVLLHDNARPHTARRTAAVLTEFGWELFDHPLYSPDLAPSDFHVFLHLKKFLSSDERFGNDEELKTSVTRWFHSQAAEFYDRGIQKLIPRYDKCLNSDGGYVEK
ncbi:hypothetical protein ANN_02875 [Periplaneta americana]|uniref:Histone-lysine N-methyltransferase SETMAR n=1 Tax=Periplaneta americana TaxID=6978 RepID=A0ABQ8TZY6_PERAM|nr:hypothetical protein ANN_02875 [Periplaneta americana]